jgi:DNA (cytosine-5)-methyltransferase 1
MSGPLATTNKATPFLSVVDLFCGAGGLTRGLLDEGINVVAGIDLDPACKFPFEHNNKAAFLNQNVADVSGKNLAELYPTDSLRVLVGCAPCQPFSKYTQGIDSQNDSKWNLLHSFARLIKELKPKIVSMENVPELQKHSVFQEFIEALRSLNYDVSHSVVFCPDYGIPQLRSRLVLFASQFGRLELIPPTHKPEQYITVKSTIGHLPALRAGKADAADPLHRCSSLTPVNKKRIRASRPGGTWRDWSPELVAECHKKKKGKTYPSVYGRMEWDVPSPFVTL